MATFAPELVIDHGIQPQIDGHTNTFQTQYDYIPGTLTMYWNGQAAVHTKGLLELSHNTFILEPDVHGQLLYPTPDDNVWVTYMA
jgi:hypothetical protein